MATTATTDLFRLPKILQNYWRTKEMAEKKITQASVLALVGKHDITASKGAALLDMSLWDFMDLMHEHGFTLCDDTPEEMEQGLRDLRRVMKKRAKEIKTAHKDA